MASARPSRSRPPGERRERLAGPAAVRLGRERMTTQPSARPPRTPWRPRRRAERRADRRPLDDRRRDDRRQPRGGPSILRERRAHRARSRRRPTASAIGRRPRRDAPPGARPPTESPSSRRAEDLPVVHPRRVRGARVVERQVALPRGRIHVAPLGPASGRAQERDRVQAASRAAGSSPARPPAFRAPASRRRERESTRSTRASLIAARSASSAPQPSPPSAPTSRRGRSRMGPPSPSSTSRAPRLQRLEESAGERRRGSDSSSAVVSLDRSTPVRARPDAEELPGRPHPAAGAQADRDVDGDGAGMEDVQRPQIQCPAGEVDARGSRGVDDQAGKAISSRLSAVRSRGRLSSAPSSRRTAVPGRLAKQEIETATGEPGRGSADSWKPRPSNPPG